MIDLASCRAQSLKSVAADERIQTLEQIVLDLMMEVEALRATVTELTSTIGPGNEGGDVLDDGPAGVAGPHTAYGKAYLETAWRSHWVAGLSSGWDKILEQFYGGDASDAALGANGRRELLMLRRMGYNDAQLAQYLDSARAAETCT